MPVVMKQQSISLFFNGQSTKQSSEQSSDDKENDEPSNGIKRSDSPPSDSAAPVEGDGDASLKIDGVGEPVEIDDVVKEEREDVEQNPPKRQRTTKRNTKRSVVAATNAPPPMKQGKRCDICKQIVEDVRLYEGHPKDSLDEYVALTDEKLVLFNGDETVSEGDERPINRLTQFSVYDKAGHLCPFDTGLIEKNVLLYFSGYIKAVYEEDPSHEGGIPAHDMGPINEWFVSGFDGGQRAILGFSTAYGEYYLMEASDDYKPIMVVAFEKVMLSKSVIEFLIHSSWEDPKYEDLLQHLNGVQVDAYGNSITEDNLLRHAQFVCDQVISFDSYSTDTERLLIATPCMRALVKLAGVTFNQRHKIRKFFFKERKTVKWSAATTTKLVSDVFETIFADQIDGQRDGKGPRRKRCGVCEACQSPDCGQCNYCRAMLKFGGGGRTKQACSMRRCPNMAIDDAEESDNEQEDDDVFKDDTVAPSTSIVTSCSKRIIHEVEFVGEAVMDVVGRECYDAAKVGDDIVRVKDFVMLNSQEPNLPPLIAKVISMYRLKSNQQIFHAQIFCRGADTILGETSDSRELFLVNHCFKSPIGSIVRKANVVYQKAPDDWSMRGGTDCLPPHEEDDGKTFFYRKRYDSEHARFEDIDDETPDEPQQEMRMQCLACRNVARKKQFDIPFELSSNCVQWRDEEYKPGVGVYLEPNAFEDGGTKCAATVVKQEANDDDGEEVDHDLYPEFYRKTSENVKGSYHDTPRPFCVGLVVETRNVKGQLHLLVRKFYRPEDTHRGLSLTKHCDLNMLYWTDDCVLVDFDAIVGRCYVAFKDGMTESSNEWSRLGPDRFYFNEGYDTRTNSFCELPMDALLVGGSYTGKGKGVGKGKSTKKSDATPVQEMPSWPSCRPLRTLDVFAGCGGLSEGLHQAGIADTRWAIEQEPAAAEAFRQNHPDAVVYSNDCNDILRKAMDGDTTLPQRGDVELLVGGPPCQGFSGMNRFNAGQYSLFKNSLIASYLSYCDYYRPRYFILENVRNFVSFKRSMVLKLTMRCLLAMGYQVTMGILQAGQYGVPQTRRRLIILAAAPGSVLPDYPVPVHVFSRRACQLQVIVGNKKYVPNMRWNSSGPYRPITVWDAMYDLPIIDSGSTSNEQKYSCDPITHFQRNVRGDGNSKIMDHVCKSMAPLVEARMALIPVAAGADWRDLPNISVTLSDGTQSSVLQYTHRYPRQKDSEPARGVCSCASGQPCQSGDRQFGTLIPWCLPHTGNRHNHWSGLYGRLEWSGFFSTTVTNPEPMGKQGRVLHPDQHRVVSVRECARSQGFPDRYRFCGNIMDRHRQIGNAVPPPLGKAIGREILKALASCKPVSD